LFWGGGGGGGERLIDLSHSAITTIRITSHSDSQHVHFSTFYNIEYMSTTHNKNDYVAKIMGKFGVVQKNTSCVQQSVSRQEYVDLREGQC